MIPSTREYYPPQSDTQINERISVQFIQADVRSWQAQVAAFEAAVKFHPNKTLDTVVAAAGNFSEPYIGLNDDDEEPVLASLDEDLQEPPTVAWETNTIGLAFTAKLTQLYFELPATATATSATGEHKSLLLIASLADYVDVPIMAAYTSSKYGARGLFRSIRSIFASRGHRVNLMAPWAIPTAMTVDWIRIFRAVGAAEGHMSQAVMSALRCASDKDVDGVFF